MQVPAPQTWIRQPFLHPFLSGSHTLGSLFLQDSLQFCRSFREFLYAVVFLVFRGRDIVELLICAISQFHPGIGLDCRSIRRSYLFPPFRIHYRKCGVDILFYDIISSCLILACQDIKGIPAVRSSPFRNFSPCKSRKRCEKVYV